jgi:transcriptional regulator with XRE-family HTH domain
MTVTFEVPAPGEEIGAYLRDRRLAAGLSQQEVEDRSGVARSNVAAIEAGTRPASPKMVARLLAAIRGEEYGEPPILLSPPVLINIEVGRAAALRLAVDPDGSRQKMIEGMALLRSALRDGQSDRWLDFWDQVLERWSPAKLIPLLLSTNREDIDWRKVSPLRSLLDEVAYDEAVARARTLWRGSR